ncbi:hypothetical protein DFP95_1281, partial [Cohnella lupini]
MSRESRYYVNGKIQDNIFSIGGSFVSDVIENQRIKEVTKKTYLVNVAYLIDLTDEEYKEI